MADIFEVPSPDKQLLEKADQLKLAAIKTSQKNNKVPKENPEIS